MSRATFSPFARRDLHDIFDYIAADKPEAAFALVKRIENACRQPAKYPEMGALREDLAPSLQAFAVRSYVVLDRPAEHGAEIVRIIHGARDLPRIVDLF